ncbi:unnamed protein product [Rotaria socialis]|uniref:Uncharacterized protein n=1 Tax=Rotaria socialis TaxID=392032 RepID=A0A817UPG5_9BILA|nr:unnamed protein product [Rotaria socialis]CAF3753187.1 unnamed protein product [Rotaria socialis]CAF4440251.1 unnamed protein product [Rotaria socialis]CAF4628296.1 unnamed protein product [Rotaria socialis]
MSDFNFEYMNEASIDALLKCRLCSKPFFDPIITRDGDRFCRKCITQKESANRPTGCIRQSSFIENLVPMTEKLLLDMLDSLTVKCTQCQKINTRVVHLQQHLQHECPKRIVLCIASDLKCPWMGPYDEFDSHIQKCTFHLLRPILMESLQFQKQFEQYKQSYDQQQQEIEQLREKMKSYENHMEKLQKAHTIILGSLSQQVRRCSEFEKDLQQIREEFNKYDNQQIELKQELQLIKEQTNQASIPSDEIPNESHRLNQLQQAIDDVSSKFQQLDVKIQLKSVDDVTNQLHQLDVKCQQRSDQSQNEIQKLKVEFNQRMTPLNEYQLEIRKLQEEGRSQKDEITTLKQNVKQHDTQILLMAKEKSDTPNTLIHQDGRIEALMESIDFYSDVDLSRKKIGDQDMEFLCKKVIVDSRCGKLRLEHNEISGNGATTLADILYTNTSLVELNLSSNQISDTGARALARALSINNETMEWLELDSNNITDDGADYLADMLKTNTTIEILNLGSNAIGDRGVRQLISAITSHNNTLQCLNLTSNKLITDACVNDLIKMIQHNQSNHVVWLNNCSLSKNAVEKLKQEAEKKGNFALEA